MIKAGPPGYRTWTNCLLTTMPAKQYKIIAVPKNHAQALSHVEGIITELDYRDSYLLSIVFIEFIGKIAHLGRIPYLISHK